MKQTNSNNNKELISSWLLNENTLLFISKNKNEEYPTVSIGYEKYNELHSKTLAKLTPGIRIEYNEKMIAMLKKTDGLIKRYKLIFVYDTTRQEFVETSNMYLYYKACKYEAETTKKIGTKKK